MIISIGTAAYAAHNIAGTIESFSYLPGMGFGVAAATLVGQNLGAGSAEDAFDVGKKSYLLSTVFMMVVGAVFFIFARPLVSLFTEDLEVIEWVLNEGGAHYFKDETWKDIKIILYVLKKEVKSIISLFSNIRNNRHRLMDIDQLFGHFYILSTKEYINLYNLKFKNLETLLTSDAIENINGLIYDRLVSSFHLSMI